MVKVNNNEIIIIKKILGTTWSLLIIVLKERMEYYICIILRIQSIFRHCMVPLDYSTQGKDGILYMYNIENLIYI